MAGTLTYYFRLTFKKNFPAVECWIRTWNGFWSWLQFSALQKAINGVALWLNCGCFCLSWLPVQSPFFCKEAKQAGFFRLACFYSFLVCFYSCEFAKLLHFTLNWIGSQKCPEWLCFVAEWGDGIPWNQMVLRTYFYASVEVEELVSIMTI